jgi:hypothetical protein
VAVCNLDLLDMSRDERGIPGEASYMIDLCVMQCGISLLADDRENGTVVFVSLRRAGKRLLMRRCPSVAVNGT